MEFWLFLAAGCWLATGYAAWHKIMRDMVWPNASGYDYLMVGPGMILGPLAWLIFLR